MSNSVKLAKNVSVEDLEYEGPMKNSYGGKFARVKSGGRWLLVQSPKMSSPFGVNKWEILSNQLKFWQFELIG